MKNTRFLVAALTMALTAGGCGMRPPPDQSGSAPVAATGADGTANPLLRDFDTPYGVPPFDLIEDRHFLPAFRVAIARHASEIEAIANNPAAPTFANTIEALELAGADLTRVRRVFFPLKSANSNEAIREVARQVGPMLSRHRDDILLNRALYARVRAVRDSPASAALDADEARLLYVTHKEFVRGGADLEPEEQQLLRELNERLSVLSIRFGENVLRDTDDFQLIIDTPDGLAGLPPNIVAGGAAAATAAGLPGKWLYTIHRTSMEPFLQYADSRPLRERIYRAYINKGNNDNAFNNRQLVAEIAALRAERAGVLGYPSHAHFVLDDNMANNPADVYALLNRLWPAALGRARAEVDELQAIVDDEGGGFDLQAWDWRYYAEKLRRQKYDFDTDTLRPYFRLNDVIEGAFLVANRLYGITFNERTDLPVYHPEVRTYEVREQDGTLLGIYYTDWYPRAGKRGGAWMNSFRKQSAPHGTRVLPVITNVGNFTKPTAEQPSLLRFSEVNTLFHEFGHALHGLLSDGRYDSLTGTSVARDFVEFPSQLMENWAASPEVLKLYAHHYQTGAPIPDDLIGKIERSATFNQGFRTTEYLAAALLDLDWHTLTTPAKVDAAQFEAASLARMGLIGQIDPRYRSTYFTHIFSGGYAAGYYSYIWSEVLDADAFRAFEEAGNLFDPQLAGRFRREILARGGAADGMDLYVRFRGKQPSTAPLIERRGLD